MNQNQHKKKAAFEALKYIQDGYVVGIGTGSTVEYFINFLSNIQKKILGTVSSSNVSSNKLKNLGILLLDINKVKNIDIYIDSADEINSNLQMIKGGGGALTREKIIASAANKFVCIIDISKKVDFLGKFPLPIEIIPMARSFVSRELIRLGGIPKYRFGFITDNGNNILDVYKLKISDPIFLEKYINNIPGVVTVGLFANRTADIAIVGCENGIEVINKI